jgi:ribosomal protein L37AE/L43A
MKISKHVEATPLGIWTCSDACSNANESANKTPSVPTRSATRYPV